MNPHAARRGGVIGVTALLIGTAPITAATDVGSKLFTRSQAQRGEQAYMEHCASCHGMNLEGKGAPALGGPAFQAKWGDGRHTLEDLYYVVRTSMPSSEPGRLSTQQYLDLIAYLLKMNGYQEGEQELVANTTALRAVTIRGH